MNEIKSLTSPLVKIFNSKTGIKAEVGDNLYYVSGIFFLLKKEGWYSYSYNTSKVRGVRTSSDKYHETYETALKKLENATIIDGVLHLISKENFRGKL